MSQSIDKFRQMRDEKRKQLAAIMAQEEQQAGSFQQLRESYAKMLASRFSFSTEAAQWAKANRLAKRDYIARVDEMRALYIGANGDTGGFQAPRLYYLVKSDFNPGTAEIMRLDAEQPTALQLTEQAAQ